MPCGGRSAFETRSHVDDDGEVGQLVRWSIGIGDEAASRLVARLDPARQAPTARAVPGAAAAGTVCRVGEGVGRARSRLRVMETE